MEIKQYEEPFRHWVVDGWELPCGMDDAIASLVELDGKSEWVKYNNALEKKYACNQLHSLPVALRCAVDDLLCLDDLALRLMLGEHYLGGTFVAPDFTFHGGGIHVYPSGGFLGPHVDYALHPKIPGKERRLNAILFLNDIPKEFGGAFCLYDDTAKTVVAKVHPKCGRWCFGNQRIQRSTGASE